MIYATKEDIERIESKLDQILERMDGDSVPFNKENLVLQADISARGVEALIEHNKKKGLERRRMGKKMKAEKNR